MAFGSNRPTGIWFNWQAAMAAPVKFTVFAGHDPVPISPNGLRTYPVDVATRPVTGSTAPAVTARVVAGSKTVPNGNVRPRASVTVPDWPVIRSREVCVTAGPLSCRRHAARQNRALNSPQTFIVRKEEQFVSAVDDMRNDHRATGGHAKLVLAKFALPGCRPHFQRSPRRPAYRCGKIPTAEPWKSFVPDFIVAFRIAAPDRPNSALKSEVCTLNS